jgi:hypothetical protein
MEIFQGNHEGAVGGSRGIDIQSNEEGIIGARVAQLSRIG